MEQIKSLSDIAKISDYSLVSTLACDPDATESGDDFSPRQVFSGHYVPVKPTAIENPVYVAHSRTFFDELAFDHCLVNDESFTKLFTGDLTHLPAPMRKLGWATGYALSIYGTEYNEQCPFRTGNGYGDGRAISVLEIDHNGQRWEMQLKGGGPTPYCRGGDGRAVLRSSVREFLAQEHMHALGVPTSRSLCLYMSSSEKVHRPWYVEDSQSFEPEIMVENPVAISTRVAPSFLRVGQLELFGRRVRKQSHPEALKELEMIFLHVIEREYQEEIDDDLPLEKKVVLLATKFRERLATLVANWIRVGYCQGNFNSDNCALGGYTLDYGPFGYCEQFDPIFQPWTGGGRHFAFFNQPLAAGKNFDSFCSALVPLISQSPDALHELENIRSTFSNVVEEKMEIMWASKLGLDSFDADLYVELMQLMVKTKVDYTIFFRELSDIPNDISTLALSFYRNPSQELTEQWLIWFEKWKLAIAHKDESALRQALKGVNPKYTWREWLVVPAYEQAAKGDFSLIQELQTILTNPYEEQSEDVESKFYQRRPEQFMLAGGVSHYSCSS